MMSNSGMHNWSRSTQHIGWMPWGRLAYKQRFNTKNEGYIDAPQNEGYIDGLVEERCNSIANALELRLTSLSH